MTISKDRVKPSPLPDSWKLKEIFATGVVLGGYLALMTVIFFWAMHETDFFPVRDEKFALPAHPFNEPFRIARFYPALTLRSDKCRINLV